MPKKREWFNFDKAMLLLIILVLFVILKTFFAPPETVQLLTDLEQEAEVVLNTLTDGNTEISLLSSDEVIDEKIENFDQMDYDEIKDILGVKSDFCIYFEDVTGNLVKINDVDLGIGSDKIRINGNPCK